MQVNRHGFNSPPESFKIAYIEMFYNSNVGMVLANTCHRQNMKTSIINGSEVSRLSVAIQFTITSVARTTREALSAFLRPQPQKSTSYPPKTSWNGSCAFYAYESLCTQVHGNRSAPRFFAWSLKHDEKSLPETVNGRINFLSGCEALDKRSASEKRLVEASGYQGYPLSTRL